MMDFGSFEYIVKRIDGDYAVLVRSDIESEDEIFAKYFSCS